MEENKTNRLSGYSLYIIFSLAIITTLVIVIGVIISVEESTQTREIQNTNPAIYWEITKIEPNPDASQNVDVTVESNAGVIQNYKNLLSYGISKNGQYLAIHTDNGIEIIDLNTDSTKKVIIEGDAYVGDSGKALSWSYDSNYFTLGVVNTNNLSESKIWVVDKDANVVSTFDAELIVEQSDKVRVGNVYFSPFNKLILARTYKEDDLLEVKEDGSEYMLTQLPIYLTIFSTDGSIVSSFQIRDYDSSSQNLYYQWDTMNEGFIKYGLFESEIDPTDNTQITRLKI